jgi:hypothetical protein
VKVAVMYSYHSDFRGYIAMDILASVQDYSVCEDGLKEKLLILLEVMNILDLIMTYIY